MRKFEAAILRLYRRLLKIKPDTHIMDQEIIASISLPTPTTLLRRSRLRYLSVLLRCAVPDLWHLLCADRQWIQVIEDDMKWMWEQLRRASALKDPSQHPDQWFDLISHHSSYWKKLVNRACLHETMQIQKQHIVTTSLQRMCNRLHEHCDDWLGNVQWETPDQKQVEEQAFYGCLSCGLRCKNKAGEAAHMFRVHGQQSIVRSLFEGTQCEACLKEFHTYGRVKAHLYYSHECRNLLLSRGGGHAVQPGVGSFAGNELVRSHDRMLPPLQAAGPRLPDPGHREFQDIDDKLYIFLVDFFADHQDKDVEQTSLHDAICGHIKEHAISWTRAQCTFHFFVTNIDEAGASVFGFALKHVQDIFAAFRSPATWHFGSQTSTHRLTSKSIQHYHESLRALKLELEQAQQMPAIPKMFGRHRIILNAFAGRRRVGDVQYYLERDRHVDDAYFISVVSLDIVIDATWGDASKASTRQLWMNAIRERFVLAFLAGPPCETWSRVRSVNPASDEQHAEQPQQHLPRVLRDEEFLWGYSCLAIREIKQVNIGNCLLCFSLEALLETALAGSVGMLEHPAEPTDLEGSASIWKLPIVQVLQSLPGVQRLKFAQGLMGSRSPKPTELMCVNLPAMMSFLHKYRVRRELPQHRAVGKDEAGVWRTTTLKEYAPAFCRAISSAIRAAFASCEAADVLPSPPEAFVNLCRSMQASSFGHTIGKDYAGG